MALSGYKSQSAEPFEDSWGGRNWGWKVVNCLYEPCGDRENKDRLSGEEMTRASLICPLSQPRKQLQVTYANQAALARHRSSIAMWAQPNQHQITQWENCLSWMETASGDRAETLSKQGLAHSKQAAMFGQCMKRRNLSRWFDFSLQMDRALSSTPLAAEWQGGGPWPLTPAGCLL